jgi:hypothetical protein
MKNTAIILLMLTMGTACTSSGYNPEELVSNEIMKLNNEIANDSVALIKEEHRHDSLSTILYYSSNTLPFDGKKVRYAEFDSLNERLVRSENAMILLTDHMNTIKEFREELKPSL